MAARLIESLWVAGITSAPNGTVRFYAPKTLTPVSVYQDDAASIVVTQPVSLDANGRSSVPLYATAPVRAVILDVNGATVADIERIDGDRAELVALANTSWPLSTSVNAALTNLATSLGGTDGGYKSSLVGATSRNLQSKLQDIVSVKDYGAKGDGSTDDTAAINACISAAGATSGVYFPAGTYLTSSPITVNAAGQTLFGVGPYSSIIKNTSGTGNAITIANVANVTIQNLGITHSSTSTGAAIQQQGTAHLYEYLDISGHRTGLTGLAGRAVMVDVQTDNNAAGAGYVAAGNFDLLYCTVNDNSSTHVSVSVPATGVTRFRVIGCSLSGGTTGAGNGSINIATSSQVVSGVIAGCRLGSSSGIGSFTNGNGGAGGTGIQFFANTGGGTAGGALSGISDLIGSVGQYSASAATATVTIDLGVSTAFKVKQPASGGTTTLAFVGKRDHQQLFSIQFQNTSAGATTWALGANIVAGTPATAASTQSTGLFMFDSDAGKIVQIGGYQTGMTVT